MPKSIAQVNFVRPEVTDKQPIWDLISDCVAGQKCIKQKGTAYLPKPNESDLSTENETRYKQYVERAVFYGVTGRTLKGLIGQVFQKDPVATLPANLEVLKEDADGGGVGLDQQAKRALAYALQFGRGGILVDYPRTAGPATIAEVEAGDVRPTIVLYLPGSVINWRTTTVGSKKFYSLIVIRENYSPQEDLEPTAFDSDTEEQFRVLRLDAGRNYYVQLWRKSPDGKSYYIAEQFLPADAKGQPWKEIPFIFLGSENNDEECDQPPLYDLATLNVAHYRNSADYEESAYMLGQPTPWVAGVTENWVKDVLKGRMQLGSRAIIPLPENGSAGILQAEPNSLAKEAMDAKEVQMVALGAKLVEQRKVQQTATEAGFSEASEQSVLSTCAANVSKAYTKALNWCARFIGAAETDISYELNSEFEINNLDAQGAQAVVALWQSNAIAKEEMRDKLKIGGWAYLDDEEYAQAIEDEGINLGVPVGSAASVAADQADAKAKADAALAKTKAAGKPPAVGAAAA